MLREHTKKNRMTQAIKQDIENILQKHSDAFAVDDKELIQTELVKMTINTYEHFSVKIETGLVPLGIRTKLRKMLQDLEKRLRLFFDHREISKHIKLDSFQIPPIDAILQNMAGKLVFSTLDICTGYWQIPLDEESREKPTFTTPEGLYQFLLEPFGLSTSPVGFQRLMDAVLTNLLGKEVFL